jgi:hypothetical protein
MRLAFKLSEKQTTVLEAKAADEDLSLDEWIDKIAQPAYRHIIMESMKDVPSEIIATIPKDAASQHDHYICGWPKKNEE